ncbi:unnamed protein product [Arabis nemorensis]|uniref:SKP1-like protein n=1 Tax=Arabis nemorensis TaxID=586526 RepID=A0A565BYA0_9BRAS|nr:unnamed protein product [Arabis nemorensis]
MASENPDVVVVAPVVENGESSNGKEEQLESELSKKLVIGDSDGVSFEVEEPVARQFQIVAHMIEDDCAGKTIPIANVTGNILSKAIQYCEKHVEEEGGEFMKPHEKDMDMVFQLILAANYLSIKGFLDLTCRTAANYIKDKKPEEVRKIFNIENDFTPEEEAEILKENEWPFQ